MSLLVIFHRIKFLRFQYNWIKKGEIDDFFRQKTHCVVIETWHFLFCCIFFCSSSASRLSSRRFFSAMHQCMSGNAIHVCLIALLNTVFRTDFRPRSVVLCTSCYATLHDKNTSVAHHHLLISITL